MINLFNVDENRNEQCCQCSSSCLLTVLIEEHCCSRWGSSVVGYFKDFSWGQS